VRYAAILRDKGMEIKLAAGPSWWLAIGLSSEPLVIGHNETSFALAQLLP
jgi:hypothetical protein